MFAHPITGDFRLLASSPLIGLDPTQLGAGPLLSAESSTDLNGLPRVTGNGRDLGAYQHQIPAVTATAMPTTAAPGTTISFNGGGSTTTPSDPLTFAWRFDDGATASGTTAMHAFASPGAHSGTLTATDSLGFTGSAVAAVTVAVPGVHVTGVSQSAARWVEGNALARFGSARIPVGTTFRFTLDVPAGVTFAFVRLAPGRHVGGRCVAQTHGNRHKPACTRKLAAGSLSFLGHAGVNAVRFEGRLSAHSKLPLGRYAMTLTATASGNHSAPQQLNFTVVGR
jgi:hypothetical protein